MKKAAISAFLFPAAFSILLVVSAVLTAGCTFAEDQPGLTGEVNNSVSSGPGESGQDNGTSSSAGEDETNPFFQDVALKALNFGDFVRYDEDEMVIYNTADDRNDISLSIDRSREMQRIYIKDLYSGYEYVVYPQDGHYFLLVSVTAAPVGKYLERHTSPMTQNFRVIDPSGNYSPRFEILGDAGAVIVNDTVKDTMVNERFVIRNVGDIYVGEKIFSSLNKVKGSGAASGWIIYEVPENFSLSAYTFIECRIGDDRVYWRLHDLIVDLRVKKNQDTGKITVSYYGGEDGYLIRALDANLVRADGSVEEMSFKAGADEDSLPETEFYFTGTPGAADLVTVKFTRLDGEEFVKYQKEI